MNITLFGATGKTGILLIQRALEDGHHITVYARTPAKLSMKHENLTIVQGELAELNHIEKAVKNADAVISVLGPTTDTKGLVIADGTKNIISAMKKNGAKRLIATATPSFKDKKDRFQFGYAFAVLMVKSLMKTAYLNIVKTGSLIIKSELDWTIVRLPMLSDKPKGGKLHIGYPGHGTVNLFSLSRADLASFLLDQIEDRTYLHQSPVISN